MESLISCVFFFLLFNPPNFGEIAFSCALLVSLTYYLKFIFGILINSLGLGRP